MLTLALKLALKFFLTEKSKADESPWGKKKKKKNRPREERKDTTLSSKEKKILS